VISEQTGGGQVPELVTKGDVELVEVPHRGCGQATVPPVPEFDPQFVADPAATRADASAVFDKHLFEAVHHPHAKAPAQSLQLV
jgi:hypothetical protein